MKRLIQAFIWWVTRTLVHRRYRVIVEGLDKIQNLRGPILVMPNHPGYIDPVLILSHIRFGRLLRPVVAETNYRLLFLYPLMRLVDALEVPELTGFSQEAQQRTKAMIDAVVAGLAREEGFVIYPSGRAQHDGVEVIGAARSVAEILARSPQASVVLVRTRGLWGSSFTYARTGQSPKLGSCLARGFGWLVAGLFFFVPKRTVTMTIEWVAREDLPGTTRETLNSYLERWYNLPGREPPTFVPYHRWFGPRTFQFPETAAAGSIDLEKIRPATAAAVNEMIEEHLGRPLAEDEKRPETDLDQVGLDSLDRMSVALKIEDRFGFRADQVAATLGELWALAEGQLARTTETNEPAPAGWETPPRKDRPVEILAETIAEAFVRRALAIPDEVAVADRISGVLKYRKLLVAARLFGHRLGQLPEQTVGVMLPASVAADVVFFGLHLAGKLPAMLNWTTGPAYLAHAAEKLGIRHVVTSRKLIDRLGIEIQGAEYLYLEDIRPQIGKLRALAALLATYLFPRAMLRGLPRQDPQEPAVVLFTSGSESTPKAVPLTHSNLASNARAGIAHLDLVPADAMLALLPPFHSFGLLGNVVAPVLGGIRAVYHPDPTDAAGLVRTMAQYRTTLLISTPTFLSYMFALATPDDLRSVRLIVSGAEKCPERIFARAEELAPQAVIMEGYGITECSPVIAANPLHRTKRGTVGRPVAGVEVCVVDPESRQPLGTDAAGLLLVRGPSVFHGYLAYEGPDPFWEVSGKRWYNTGDLVQIDGEGYIRFCGRLKRFLKAGGEMISLPALEELFAGRYPPGENGPQVAVEGIETPRGRWIVLYTTQELSLRQANALLAEAGFRGVMRVDEVVRLDAIPVLGTGKTDYKILRNLVSERAHSAAT